MSLVISVGDEPLAIQDVMGLPNALPVEFQSINDVTETAAGHCFLTVPVADMEDKLLALESFLETREGINVYFLVSYIESPKESARWRGGVDGKYRVMSPGNFWSIYQALEGVTPEPATSKKKVAKPKKD